jgi:hypothetical protein
MVTRLLINLDGLHENELEGGRKIIRDELHNLLRNKFKTTYEIDREKAQDILPDDIKYSEETNELIRVHRRSKEEYKFKLE